MRVPAYNMHLSYNVYHAFEFLWGSILIATLENSNVAISQTTLQVLPVANLISHQCSPAITIETKFVSFSNFPFSRRW